MWDTIGLPRWLSGQRIHLKCRRCRKHEFDTWVGKIPCRRTWQPTPVFLPGEFQGQRNLENYNPQGRKESDMTEVTEHIHTHMLFPQQLFLIIPEVEPHFLFWGQCIQIHRMTHSLPNPIMILLFCAVFGLRNELWIISCNRNICAPPKNRILAKNHMQLSWHHKRRHFYTQNGRTERWKEFETSTPITRTWPQYYWLSCQVGTFVGNFSQNHPSVIHKFVR